MQLVIVLLIVLCVIGLMGCAFYRFGSGGVQYVSSEEVETKPSVYRGEEATALITVIEYWIGDIIPEEAQPHVYSTDDYTISYINYSTTNGFLRCAINWSRNMLDLHYSKHDEAEGECRELRRKVKRDNDTAIVQFLLEVKRLDMSLADDTAELLANLQRVATSPEAAEDMKDQSTGSVLITLCVFLTSYLMRQKRPDDVLVALYKQLSVLLFQRYHDEMEEFLKEHKPHDEADVDAEKSNPSE